MAEKKDNQQMSLRREVSHFILSGISAALAYITVYPLETLKTRTQVHSEAHAGNVSSREIMRNMLKTEGAKSFYRGLSAALFHPLLCTSSRLGLFFLFEDLKKRKNGKKVLSFMEKSYLSLVAGGLGEVLVVPFDVIYVRFQADYELPKHLRSGYKGVFNAFKRIIAEEGPLSLWKGTVPSILKCMLINFGMLTPYYECKERLNKYLGMTKVNYLISAAIAGLGSSIVVLPMDNMKVKLQKMRNTKEYKGMLDCAIKTYKNEGIKGFWSGLFVFYAFFAPNIMLTLLFNDFFRISTHLSHC
jgi:solute carrier family 25 oxoglutarate transporter 11